MYGKFDPKFVQQVKRAYLGAEVLSMSVSWNRFTLDMGLKVESHESVALYLRGSDFIWDPAKPCDAPIGVLLQQKLSDLYLTTKDQLSLEFNGCDSVTLKSEVSPYESGIISCDERLNHRWVVF